MRMHKIEFRGIHGGSLSSGDIYDKFSQDFFMKGTPVIGRL